MLLNRQALWGGKDYDVMKRAIAYYRVSTERQGRSGLGLEAQQKFVADFVLRNGYVLIEEIIETESGLRNGRMGLNAALQECKRLDATLLIAKLDRLSRRVSFIASLMECGVTFKVVDNPFAEPFTLHILAAVAQKEREDISKRTTLALAAAKARGIELGKFGKEVLSQRNKEKADAFALSIKPVIEKIKSNGVQTVRGIADELNRLKVKTAKGGKSWYIQTVYSLLQRLKQLSQSKD